MTAAAQRDTRQAKCIAALQTACICVAVELALVLLLGTVVGSYLGGLAVSLVILGPVSLFLAPMVYGHLLHARGQAMARA